MADLCGQGLGDDDDWHLDTGMCYLEVGIKKSTRKSISHFWEGGRGCKFEYKYYHNYNYLT